MPARETNTLIIGASVSGLACAACLYKEKIDYTIIEKENQVASPWRRHYDRLHLHTNKRISSLPYKKFGSDIPRYPSRQQVVEYLEDYKNEFKIAPLFNTEAKSVKKENEFWITQTNNGTFKSKFIIVATGPFGKPKPVSFRGMETFPGKILHSFEYKTGKDFKGQRVLVVGFGNSACEIAIDLVEQGARPSMSVRSPVNVIPRDILGIPILEISLLMNRLPPAVADFINAPVIRLLAGNLNELGLKKSQSGPLEAIRKEGKIPVLDIGTLNHIRQGRIKVFGGLDHIEDKTVFFGDGKKEEFDFIVGAIGFYRDCAEIIDVDKSRFEDLKMSADHQEYFGKDNLYFCGFWIGPTGQIREIASDAKKITSDIAKKMKT